MTTGGVLKAASKSKCTLIGFFQAFSLGLGEKFDEVKKMYREANLALGDLIKVILLSTGVKPLMVNESVFAVI